GQAVRAELLQDPLFLAGVERPVWAEARGDRGIDEVAGVARAHLEEDAQLELAERLTVEHAMEVVPGIAPDDRVDAVRRAFAQHLGELPRRRLRLLPATEAEVVIGLLEVSES